MRWSASAVVLATVLASATLCHAGFLIYTNRSVAEYGTDNAGQIGFPNHITQFFSLTQAATPTSATIGVWVPYSAGHLGLQSVTYKLGTTQEGVDRGTATVTVNSTYLYTNTRGYDIFRSDFSLPSSSSLSANTNYYFSLSNALSNPPDFTFWDVRSSDLTYSLTLFGDPPAAAATPAPGGLILLAAGGALLGLIGQVRRGWAARAEPGPSADQAGT